jgi:hypothetical protein
LICEVWSWAEEVINQSLFLKMLKSR